MTPRQKQEHQKALGSAAAAPNKRWLGKCTLLTGIQSAWIKSLLTTWGEGMRGGTAPRIPKGHACWRMLRHARWSDSVLEKFTAAITQARGEGLKGEAAINRAREILWPLEREDKMAVAIHNDDVDFMEHCVLQAFDIKDPVYIVGMTYYTTRRKISDITRDLQQIAPWLTADEARKRVRWCVEIFRAKVYLSVKKQAQ